MIIWVDEDVYSTTAGARRFRRMGYDFVQVSDATDGFEEIIKAIRNNMALAIIDVMLLPGNDLETFDPKHTHMGTAVGVRLVEKLLEKEPSFPWSEHLVFYSRTTDPKIMKIIENCAYDNGLLYIKKNSEMTTKLFVKSLTDKGYITQQI